MTIGGSGSQREKIRALVNRLGGTERGELLVGGFPVSQLAAECGTPFYVYSGEVLLDQLWRVQGALGSETDVYCSIKANPSLGLAQLLAGQAAGAEVASGGELLLALRAGFDPCRILFAGPGKTDEELRLAVEAGIRAVNVESAGELERLDRMARSAGRQVAVGLRINPSLALPGAKMRMGGGARQFGIDEEQVPAIVERYRDHSTVRIVGVHVYTGTQIFDVARLVEHMGDVLDLAGTIAGQLGRPLEFVDLGGGFGVPYFEGTSEFDLDTFGAGYRALLEAYRADQRLSGSRHVIELGRYLLAACGLYVTRVVDVKCSRGETFVVTDGGMNHQTMATGNFGQVFRKPYPVAVLNRLDAEPGRSATVVGPCCTPLDVIGSNLPLPDAQVGDLVGIFYSGAYGYSASSLAFLSHPTPSEVLTWHGQRQFLRAAGAHDQVLQGQLPLAIGLVET